MVQEDAPKGLSLVCVTCRTTAQVPERQSVSRVVTSRFAGLVTTLLPQGVPRMAVHD